MKKLFTILTLSLVLWSCQKTDTETITEPQTNDFVGGAIEEKPTPPPTKEFMKNGSYEKLRIANEDGTASRCADVTSPVCDIITPTPGQLMPNGPSTWTISVRGADEVGGSGLNRIEFWIANDGYFFKLPNTTPLQTSWTYTPPAFQYNPYSTLVLYVYDNCGNAGVRSIGVYRTQNLVQTPLPAGFPTVFSMVTPPVINQGVEQSTVSIATAYNQFSIEKYYRTNSTSWSNTRNVMSAEYIYNAIHNGGTTCGGTTLNGNYEFLRNTGTCFWNTLPYSNTNGCSSTLLTRAMRTEAGNNKIRYSVWENFIYAVDKGMVKNYLNNKRPLVFVARMESTTYNSGPGFIWKQSDGTSIGSTALTIVGFDDSKNAYKCMTTWGTGRGEGGFIWVDYEHMTRIALQVWYMNII